jgi:hypothetical protein
VYGTSPVQQGSAGDPNLPFRRSEEKYKSLLKNRLVAYILVTV